MEKDNVALVFLDNYQRQNRIMQQISEKIDQFSLTQQLADYEQCEAGLAQW